MKKIKEKINDSRLYRNAAIVIMIVALCTGFIGFYSLIFVEGPVKDHLGAEESEIPDRFYKAYVMLRKPHIFAGYDHFDAAGRVVKRSLQYFDRKISSGDSFGPADRQYLQLLLDRREKGSRLGRMTSYYLFIVSIILFYVYYYEKGKCPSVNSKSDS